MSCQLISSGCFAYQKLMRVGFPCHMNTDDLLNRFKLNPELPKNGQNADDQKGFCSILLRSCGLNWNDFRLGNKTIYFRNGKIDKLNGKLKDDLRNIINQYKEIILIRSKWRILLIAARFYAIAKRWISKVETSVEKRNFFQHKEEDEL